MDVTSEINSITLQKGLHVIDTRFSLLWFFVSKIVIWNKMNMTSSPPQTIDPCLCFGLRNKPKNCLIGYTQFISRKNDSFLSIVLSWYALLSYKKYIKTSLSTSFDIYSLLNLIVLGTWYNLVNKIPRNQFFAFTNKKGWIDDASVLS